MRLDPLLDAISLLNALWAGAGPQACTMRPDGPDLRSQPALMVSSAGRSDAGAVAAVTAFVDVHVIPMDTERVLAHQTVVVQDGHIAALGPASQVQVPAGAGRIDGRGKYLMPGLADMHVHGGLTTNQDRFAFIQNKLFTDLAMGITTIRHLTGSTSDLMRLWKDTTTLAVAIPRLYVAPPLRGWTPLDSMRAAVAGAEALGYDHIITPYAMRVDSLKGRAKFDSLLAAARRAGLPLAAHTHFLPFDAALTLGTAGGSTEHLYTYFTALEGFKNFEWVSMDRQQQASLDVPMPKLQALAAATRRAGLWITPTLQCSEHAYSSHTQVMRQLVKVLQEAGVGLLLSGDDGWDVHHELQALVRAGLSPYQALVTGTRNPAQWLGLLDSSGTVAVGKRADLVLLSGNPLEDVRHAREPTGVMIRGRWLDRAALDQGLLMSAYGGWFKSALSARGLLSRETANAVQRIARSLAVVKPPEDERVRQQLAAELGARRAALTSEQQEMFDPAVRVWLREQARQGHRMSVPGIAPVP